MSPQALLSALTRLVDDLTEPAPPIIITVQADEGDDIDAMIAERKKGLPPDAPVLTIVTVMGSQPPPHHAALPPRDAQRESALPRPAPQEPEPDPLVLARVMRMAHRRQLKAYHTGAHIAFTDASGETRYNGTVQEFYDALKRDTPAQLPPDPVKLLRERLSRSVGWNWTLADDGDGKYTLWRGDLRTFTGTFEDISIIAESRILNTVVNRGYPE